MSVIVSVVHVTHSNRLLLPFVVAVDQGNAVNATAVVVEVSPHKPQLMNEEIFNGTRGSARVGRKQAGCMSQTLFSGSTCMSQD